MFEESYVTFNQGMKLKNAGFPQDTTYKDYVYIDGILLTIKEMPEYKIDDTCSVPTLSCVTNWLNKNKGYFIEVSLYYNDTLDKNCYAYAVYADCTNEGRLECRGLTTSEDPNDALSKGIDEALNFIS